MQHALSGAVSLVVALTGCLLCVPVRAVPITTVIAVAGNDPPGGNGKLSTFGAPVLNNKGQVAFVATLSDTFGGRIDDDAIYRGDGKTLTQIARATQFAPDRNGNLSFFRTPALNDSGQALFFATLIQTDGAVTDNTGIFRSDGGSLVQIVRAGQAAPNRNGTFEAFSLFPAFNENGAAAFSARLVGTRGGANDDSGIFVGDGRTIQQIAREGELVPRGNGRFSDLGSVDVALRDRVDLVAFGSILTGTTGGARDNSGLFRGGGFMNRGSSEIVRQGDAAPDDNGRFFTFSAPAYAETDTVAFFAALSGTRGGVNDNSGIFLSPVGGAPVQIAREGQALGGRMGSFASFSLPAFNRLSQAAFRATLRGTRRGDADDEGLFRGHDRGFIEMVGESLIAPDGNGNFAAFQDPALNDLGQVAFAASLRGTKGGAADDGGIFLADGRGVLQVAREGDNLLGSTITRLDFSSSVAGFYDRSGLNASGQVAYFFRLADGREGIALWSPVTEPDTLMLCGLALGSILLVRRWKRLARTSR